MKLISVLIIGFSMNCVCYAIAHVKEAFAVGTLLSAIVWFFLSKKDFKYLECSKKTEIYLFIQLLSFLATGLMLPALIGCVVYMVLTIISLKILLKETLSDSINRGVDIIRKRRKQKEK